MSQDVQQVPEDVGDEDLSVIGSVNFTEDDGVITPLFVFEGSAAMGDKEHEEPETEDSESKADDPLNDTSSSSGTFSSTSNSNGVKFSDGSTPSQEEEEEVRTSPKLRRRRNAEDLPLPPNLVRTSSARPVLGTEWRTSAYLSLDHRLPGPEAAKSRAREGLKHILFSFFSSKTKHVSPLFFFFFLSLKS